MFKHWIGSALLALALTAPVSTTAQSDGEIQAAIAQSDDLDVHGDQLLTISRNAISRGICKPSDFKEVGGWTKATDKNKMKPVYVTYCGGFTRSNRYYLNLS